MKNFRAFDDFEDLIFFSITQFNNLAILSKFRKYTLNLDGKPFRYHHIFSKKKPLLHLMDYKTLFIFLTQFKILVILSELENIYSSWMTS